MWASARVLKEQIAVARKGTHVKVTDILVGGVGSTCFDRIANSVEVSEYKGAAGAGACRRQRLDTHPAGAQANGLCKCDNGKVPVLEVSGVAIGVDVIELVAACMAP